MNKLEGMMNRSKLLGQHFTPRHVARFALSGLRGSPSSILDPMVGYGIFFEECVKLFPDAKLTGVEIDSSLITASPLLPHKNTVLITSDVFRWALEEVEKNPDFSFSAIVGNPAYVSYQNLQSVQLFSKENNEGLNYRMFLLETLKKIATLKNADKILSDILTDWSGLNDLATHSLILAWLLTKSDGQIAFVMSNHWMERHYGRKLKHLLTSTGEIRGIVTHRGGKWFPNAQIPTSVIVYSKGNVPDRQMMVGVPYVEIDGPLTDNLESYLQNVLKEDFWKWLDLVSRSGRYGPLHVSFKQWAQSPKNLPKKDHASVNIVLPSNLNKFQFRRLEEVGWTVHQGLRTGCNEVFYVKKHPKLDDTYIASMTRNGKKNAINLKIPERLLYPTLQKFSRSGLTFDKSSTNTYLLNLSRSLLREDKESFKQYPESWRKSWGYDEIGEIPNSLADYLRKRSNMSYEGKGKVKVAVSELSAVKTNIYKPPLNATKMPNRPRFWYQISLQKRHFGEIAVPRVLSGPVFAILITKPRSLVIDANFLTFVSTEKKISSERLWIWLNSNAFRIICELNAVALGGGALKMEAIQLVNIATPDSIISMDDEIVISLSKILMEAEVSDNELLRMGEIIDRKCFGSRIAIENRKNLEQLIQRRRKGA